MASASQQQTGGGWLNLSRRPAPSWDALLTQCRWWERAGWWTSCHRCPATCRSLSQHWAAPSATDWYTPGVKSQVLPAAVRLYNQHCSIQTSLCTVWYHYTIWSISNTHIDHLYCKNSLLLILYNIMFTCMYKYFLLLTFLHCIVYSLLLLLVFCNNLSFGCCGKQMSPFVRQ